MSTLSVGTVKATTLQTAAGVEVYTCKAWVNFSGTGTVAIRASGNVSSITDNGVGDYTLNFTTSLPDANFACSGSHDGTTGAVFFSTSGYASGSARIRINNNNVAYDPPNAGAVIFR